MEENIIQLLEEKKHAEIKKLLAEKNIADIAGLFQVINDPKDVVVLFRLLDKDTSAEVFAFLDPEIQEHIINALTDKDIHFIMNELHLDDATDFINEMPASIVNRVLKNTSKDVRDQINKLLSYPDNSAGSIMTTEFIDLKAEITVSTAFDKIKKIAEDVESLDTIYVTDSKRILLGIVEIRDLFLAKSTDTLEQIMDTNVISAHTLCDQEEISQLFDKYDLVTMPIIDTEKRLVGIVTSDDVIDVIKEEATEDFEKMAAMTPTEDTYLKTSVFSHARKRIVWLLLLSVTAIISGTILASFEESFVAVPALVSFIPMLMDTGGNCGAQSSTLVIRGLALNEISTKQFLKILGKELSVASIVGAVLAVVNLFITWLRCGNFTLALVVAISLYITVFAAKAVGGMLPILAKKLKLDPAIMASPLITTIVDIIAISGYFTMAKLLLGI